MNVGKGAGKTKHFFCLVISVLAVWSGCARPPASVTTVESRIRSILEFPVVEYVYRDVVYLGDTRSFLFIKTLDRRLLFSVRLRVRAGMDLRSGFRLIADRGNPKRIYVQLPASRILLVDADEGSIRQYFEFGERFSRLEYTNALEQVKPKAEEDARARGILEKSDENAKRIIRSFLAAAGFERIDFLPPEIDREGKLRG